MCQDEHAVARALDTAALNMNDTAIAELSKLNNTWELMCPGIAETARKLMMDIGDSITMLMTFTKIYRETYGVELGEDLKAQALRQATEINKQIFEHSMRKHRN